MTKAHLSRGCAKRFREPAEDLIIRIEDLREIVPPKFPELDVPFKKDLRRSETILIHGKEKER